MTASMLVPVLRRWRSRRPDVGLDLVEFTSSDAMVASILENRADIAIGSRPTCTDAHLEVFGEEEIVVVAGAGHAFARVSTIPIRVLEAEPFVHYEVVKRYGGTVDKFTGDGIMAVFGAPVALEDHAVRACLAALGLQEEAKPLAEEVQDRDGVGLQLRVGLNSGQMIAGEIGSGSFGYTTIGLVETLLDRGADGDVAEAEAAIERLAAAPADEGLVIREIWLLRLRALLAQAQADAAAYTHRDRYRAMARTLDFEGHMAWAEAMP